MTFRSISKLLFVLAIFNIIAFIYIKPSNSADQKSLVLLTEDEAKDLRYKDSEWEKEYIPDDEQALTSGPSIVIEEPDVLHTDNGPTIIAVDPADIFVQFKRNGSTLDLDSLDVWAEKFFFKINVTDRIRPYIKTNKEGAVLHADAVHIPEGKFKIGIKISDTDGQEATEKYLLKVE